MSQTLGTTDENAFETDMRFLVQDVRVLFEYLGRVVPNRLPGVLCGTEKEFEASGARLKAVTKVSLHQVLPSGPAPADGSQPQADPIKVNHHLRLLEMFADIADYWSGKPRTYSANVDAGTTAETGGPKDGNTKPPPAPSGSSRNNAADWAWLQVVRSSLAEIAAPASVESILVTQSMQEELAERSKLGPYFIRGFPWLFRKTALVARVTASAVRKRWKREPAVASLDQGGGAGSPLPPGATASGGAAGSSPQGPASAPDGRSREPPEQVTMAAGRKLAWHVENVKALTGALIIAVVFTSLYVGAGKTLIDEVKAQHQVLTNIFNDVQRDVQETQIRATAAAAANRVPTAAVEAVKTGRIHDAALDYCDQPYIDHYGLVRYATTSQPINCARLWGVNRAVNASTRAMACWLRWLPFGGASEGCDASPAQQSPRQSGSSPDALPAPTPSSAATPASAATPTARQPQSPSSQPPNSTPNSAPTAPRFREAARAMTYPEAMLHGTRECLLLQEIMLQPPKPNDPSIQTGPKLYHARTGGQSGDAGSNGAHPPIDCGQRRNPTSDEAGRMVVAAQNRSGEPRDLRQPTRSNVEFQALSARIAIESLSLYLLPVLFSLLGALVALNRNLRRLNDGFLLSASEVGRGQTMLVLGAAFGAIVSLLAEVLRAGGTAGAATSPTATGVALGLWPLAFLAGYSVSHVFRMLDAAVDRIFGAPAR